jgi:hypothetical protein
MLSTDEISYGMPCEQRVRAQTWGESGRDDEQGFVYLRTVFCCNDAPNEGLCHPLTYILTILGRETAHSNVFQDASLNRLDGRLGDC